MDKLYKVLINGRSCHGGDLEWPLPDGDTPGGWVEAPGRPRLCEYGLHLTSEPWSWFKWGADVYEAEGAGEQTDPQANPHKIAFQRARLLRLVPRPDWLVATEEFVASIPATPWFSGTGEFPEGCLLFDTRAAAGAAAGAAAWDAARDAAWDAAWAAAGDAALLARCLLVSDLVASEHLEHARKRWAVWQAGYGVVCDVNGVLYCYRRPG